MPLNLTPRRIDQIEHPCIYFRHAVPKVHLPNDGGLRQRPARVSFLENSREFFFIFTSRSRSRAVSISLSLLEKEWRDFIFHFSLLEKSESYPYFTLFSREKRVKSGAGYNLTSIFVPNCISKNCQISSKHQPQNIGQISISKSWLNPVLHVWTKLQLRKKWQKFSVDILTKLQHLYQTVDNTFLNPRQ